MLGLGPATRVFVATGAIDIRLGFDGLYALVVGQLKEDPQTFLVSEQAKVLVGALLFVVVVLHALHVHVAHTSRQPRPRIAESSAP